jgi:hypothetical protein
VTVLPEIPDNDTDICWAPGCDGAVASWTESGLCLMHRTATQGMDFDRPTGHLYDVLGMRLNVLQATEGACLRSAEPCDIMLCRFHLEDRRDGKRFFPPEPCAIKLANRGGMILDEAAAAIGGCTRERARQIELSAMKHLRRACERAGIRLEDVVGLKLKAA